MDRQDETLLCARFQCFPLAVGLRRVADPTDGRMDEQTLVKLTVGKVLRFK